MERQFDYATEVMTHGLLGYHKGELDRKEFDKRLDQLGREGYELCWVFMDQKIHGEKDGHVLVFKREL